jgi:hypothetical protein
VICSGIGGRQAVLCFFMISLVMGACNVMFVNVRHISEASSDMFRYVRKASSVTVCYICYVQACEGGK